MGRKCSVFGCNSGYESQLTAINKVSIYKFPDDEEECRKWVLCLPHRLHKVTKWMGICALHWPKNTPLRYHRKGSRYPIPIVPPSIFSNIPSSTPPTSPRSSEEALVSPKNPNAEAYAEFRAADQLKYSDFLPTFKEKFAEDAFISFDADWCILLSKKRTGSIHLYSLYLNLKKSADKASDSAYVSYEAFYKTEQIFHSSVRNIICCWTELDELVGYIKNFSNPDEDLKY